MALEVTKNRFWSKVSIGGSNDCWDWVGAKRPSGYGNVRINKQYKSAHRVSWEIAYGPIANGLHVLHACDNTKCCNPRHLMLGTSTANRIDMERKGRGNHRHGNRLRGIRNPNGKLTSEQRERIRSLYIRGVTKQSDIARQFGVSQVTISLIVRQERRNNGQS